jgi:hypothetical protein
MFVKMIFCKQYFNTFMRKGKDPEPDPYLLLMDLDPKGPKTCRSCGSRSGSPTHPTFLGFSIPDLGSEFFPSRIPEPHQRISIFHYFNPKKWFLSSREYNPACSSRIPDPYPDFLPIPDPGVKKAPEPGSRIRNTAVNYKKE